MSVAQFIWLAISLVGLVGSALGTRRWYYRREARKALGINGTRLYLVNARLVTWRMSIASFLLWFVAGAVSLVDVPQTGLVVLFCLVGGFAVMAALVIIRYWQDGRLEHML